MLNEAIKKIEAQQAKLGKSPAYWVGEQLKEMLRAEPWNADLVARDLDVPEMAITAVEKKIKAAADKNTKGTVGFVSPMEADKIIREFYGFRPAGAGDVPAAADAAQPGKKRKTIRLEDFF